MKIFMKKGDMYVNIINNRATYLYDREHSTDFGSYNASKFGEFKANLEKIEASKYELEFCQ